jgi:glycosyltransferase involved in cell wall biosynthesis
VITARTPAAVEIFKDREDILLCRKEEPRDLAEAILELKRNRALREKIARNGRELVWRRYQPAALGALLEEVLLKAAESEKEANVG